MRAKAERLLKQNPVVLGVIFLVGLSSLHLVFALKTHLYFSQDDFAVLLYFKKHSMVEMIGQFLREGDIWGFKKILGFVNLRLLYDGFGVRPLPYILMNHFWHTINVVLVFLIGAHLGRDKLKALFFAAIFNSLYLFYFSNIHEYLVTSFGLIAVYCYIKSWSRAAFLAVIAAILTKELGVIIPFMFVAIDYYLGTRQKNWWIFWIPVVVYLGLQFGFVTGKVGLADDHPYALAKNMGTIGHNFLFYLRPGFLMVIIASLPLAIYKKSWGVLLAVLLSLVPALILKNRQEIYYWYLPLAFLCIYFSITFPKVGAKTLILYFGTFVILGGRSLLPRVPRGDFPNWQEESINMALKRVERILLEEPQTSSIKFSDLKLERDARHLLGSDVVDLFLPDRIVDKYEFKYNHESKELEVRAINP